MFKKLNWADEPGIGSLATKAWSVISELSIEEVTTRLSSPKSRRFKVSFKGWDTLKCGVQPTVLSDRIVPLQREISFNLRERSKQDSRLFLAVDDENLDQMAAPWNQFLFTAIEDGLSDERGLTCIVEKSAFLKDIRVVDPDKLCKGEPEVKKKITTTYLKALQEKLK